VVSRPGEKRLKPFTGGGKGRTGEAGGGESDRRSHHPRRAEEKRLLPKNPPHGHRGGKKMVFNFFDVVEGNGASLSPCRSKAKRNTSGERENQFDASRKGKKTLDPSSFARRKSRDRLFWQDQDCSKGRGVENTPIIGIEGKKKGKRSTCSPGCPR